LKDDSKKSFAAFAKDMASNAEDLTWAKRWIAVCLTLDNALENKQIKLAQVADFIEDSIFPEEVFQTDECEIEREPMEVK
jgi:hypothetical protein